MKLSKKGEYALRALIGLALAERRGQGTVALTHLAEGENIPAPFLEQILRRLKEGGYITSLRGKEGGYSLALPAERVSAGEVVRFIEGPLAPVRCVSRTAYERCSCPDENACGLRLLMERVRNSVADILDGTTLAALVDGISCTRKSPLDRKSLEREVSHPISGLRLREVDNLASGPFNSAASERSSLSKE